MLSSDMGPENNTLLLQVQDASRGRRKSVSLQRPTGAGNTSVVAMDMNFLSTDVKPPTIAAALANGGDLQEIFFPDGANTTTAEDVYEEKYNPAANVMEHAPDEDARPSSSPSPSSPKPEQTLDNLAILMQSIYGDTTPSLGFDESVQAFLDDLHAADEVINLEKYLKEKGIGRAELFNMIYACDKVFVEVNKDCKEYIVMKGPAKCLGLSCAQLMQRVLTILQPTKAPLSFKNTMQRYKSKYGTSLNHEERRASGSGEVEDFCRWLTRTGEVVHRSMGGGVRENFLALPQYSLDNVYPVGWDPTRKILFEIAAGKNEEDSKKNQIRLEDYLPTEEGGSGEQEPQDSEELAPNTPSSSLHDDVEVERASSVAAAVGAESRKRARRKRDEEEEPAGSVAVEVKAEEQTPKRAKMESTDRASIYGSFITLLLRSAEKSGKNLDTIAMKIIDVIKEETE